MSISSQDSLAVYPFSALHGQAKLQLALQLVAVDPRIGGVLIEGARGTAKTTSARALADILPQGEFVNLPLGASEEQLLGSLNLEVVLQEGRTVFQPGLLARAHRGVLYVDEINLLNDTLVDLLLDVCSSGVNRVERDGLSHQHAANIVLIGTMNPEEGELRPQLLDRFGLFVSVDESMSVLLRQAIVRSRLAFDENPRAFLTDHSQQQQRLVEQLIQARQLLPQIVFSDAHHDQVAQCCHEAQVDGVRADLVMLRASRAMAALQGRVSIQTADIEAVADLVLAHRRRQGTAAAERHSYMAPSGSNSSDSAANGTEEESAARRGDDQHNVPEGHPPAERRSNEGEGEQTGTAVNQESEISGSSDAGPGQERSNASSAAALAREASDSQWGALEVQPVPMIDIHSGGGKYVKKP